jgi:hypothetical protein
MAKKTDTLAMDAVEAKKAGMSYGRWKAMQMVEEKPKGIPDGWLVCQYCGKPFKPKDKRPRKYCELFCQQRASDERESLKRAERKKQHEEGAKRGLVW